MQITPNTLVFQIKIVVLHQVHRHIINFEKNTHLKQIHARFRELLFQRTTLIDQVLQRIEWHLACHGEHDRSESIIITYWVFYILTDYFHRLQAKLIAITSYQWDHRDWIRIFQSRMQGIDFVHIAIHSVIRGYFNAASEFNHLSD